MDWMNQLGGLLQQYKSVQDPQQHPQAPDQDFQRMSQTVPQDVLADALGASFRSPQTPAFPNMLGQVFGNSNPMQRSSILNTLLATVGPQVLMQILQRRGMGGGGGLGGLLGGLGGMMGGQQPHITPEVAAQVPPEAVDELAREAEQRDPSIVDRVSGIYAQNPQLFQTLGAAAMTVALAHLARRNNDGHF